jgi:Tol biopolymer transport system component
VLSFIDYVAIESGERAPSLWRLPFLGGTPRRLANSVWSATDWSPDGKQIAFVRVSEDLDENTLHHRGCRSGERACP